MKDFDLTDLAALEVTAKSAEVVTWGGRRALRLENGTALFKGAIFSEASLEVDVAAPGAAYPGLAFRAEDGRNMELAYVQPHTSGLWDALQYDPVFGGINTWQLFNGPRYQMQADVPVGRWLRLRVDMAGQRAAAAVGALDGSDSFQPALAISRLAHDRASGQIGVWTFQPAYFSGFRVGSPVVERLAAAAAVPAPFLSPGTISEWLLGDSGPLRVEENGTLNLNRHIDQALVGEVVIWREFAALRQGPVVIRLGYSDGIELFVDRQQVFSGVNMFSGIGPSRRSRGYVEPNSETLIVQVSPGRHVVSAHLRASEPFGWGLNLALAGDGIELMPIVS